MSRLRYRSIFVLTFALVMVASGWSFAQQVPPRPTVQRANPEADRRIIVARQLIRQQNYEGASALLEVVLETEQNNPVVRNLLMTCYEHLKYYEKAEALARDFVSRNPQNLAYRLKLAELLMVQGKRDEGAQVYQDAVKLAGTFELNRYRLIISSMIANGQDSVAIALIDSARVNQSDPHLFGVEKGQLLEKDKQYAAAAGEYYPLLLQDTTMDAMNAERRLLSLLEFVESSPEVEKTLLSVSEGTVSRRVLRLLASYYLRSEQFDKAYTYTIKQDSLEQNRGASLMNFMQQCRERKLYDQVIRMGEYVLARYPDAPFTLQAQNLYGEALTHVGRLEDALAVYDSVNANAVNANIHAEALYDIGDIYLNSLNDYPTALKYFDSVAANYPAGIGYLMSMRGTPLCYLRMGKLDEARQQFNKLLNRHLNEDMQEEARYYVGLIDFFKHDFDTAEVAFRKLVIDYPRGFFVNDALELVMMITEAKSAPELLTSYADALRFGQQKQPDSTLKNLRNIVEADNKTLADVALFKLATLELERSDSTRALEYVEKLVTGFPDSYYLPYGLKMKADVLLQRDGKTEEAKGIYRHLLESYPNYPFITEVRKKMRELETDLLIG